MHSPLRHNAKLDDDSMEAGDRFDIREFHDVLLTGGSMPLHILEEQVDAWIADNEG